MKNVLLFLDKSDKIKKFSSNVFFPILPQPLTTRPEKKEKNEKKKKKEKQIYKRKIYFTCAKKLNLFISDVF